MSAPTTRLASTRREIWSWAMFDFANSSYTTVIVTVAFSVYFTRAGGAGGAGGFPLGARDLPSAT